jgi:Tol biopolymer transport system component
MKRTANASVSIIIPGALLLLLAAACGEAPTPTPTPEPLLQRVTYLNPENAVFTVNVDGTDTQRLLGGARTTTVQLVASGFPQTVGAPRYFWPTWSPSGEHLAVSRIPGVVQGSHASLMVLSLTDRSLATAHSMEPGLTGQVLQNGPHYTQWSPDGRQLSFIVQDPSGASLGLYLTTPVEAAVPKRITGQTPLYFNWAEDATSLIVHRQSRLLHFREGDASPVDLDRRSLLYRVPAVSPSGDRIAYLAEEGSDLTLTVRDLASSQDRALMEVPSESAFLWSPTADTLAVASRPSNSQALYESLDLVDANTGERRRLLEGLFLSFFWSPNGRRLAVARPGSDSAPLEWVVVEQSTGESQTLTTFSPSLDTLNLLTFFDQFHISHSPWSPDSTHLAFSGELVSERQGGRAGDFRIYVLDASGTLPPLAVADGELAMWTPTEAVRLLADR